MGGYADVALNSCDALKTMIAGIENVEPGGLLPMPGNYDSMMVQLRDPEAAGLSEESEGRAAAHRRHPGGSRRGQT